MPRLDYCPYCRTPGVQQKKYGKTKCPVCGQQLPSIKSVGGLVAIIISLVAVLAIIGVAVWLLVVNPMLEQQKFEEALQGKDWATASDLAEDDDDRMDEFEAAIIDEAQGIFDDFLNDKIDFDKAESKLNKIKKYHSAAQDTLEKLVAYNEGKQFMDEGNWYKTNGDYNSAISSYTQVSYRLPELYSNALNEIEACVSYMSYNSDMVYWYEDYLRQCVYDLEDNVLAHPADADAQNLYVSVRDKYEAILVDYINSTKGSMSQNECRAALGPAVEYARGRDDVKDISDALKTTVMTVLNYWWDYDISKSLAGGGDVFEVYIALRINESYFVFDESYEAKFANAISIAESQACDMFRQNIIAMHGKTNDGYTYYNTVTTKLADYPEMVAKIKAIFDEF